MGGHVARALDAVELSTSVGYNTFQAPYLIYFELGPNMEFLGLILRPGRACRVWDDSEFSESFRFIVHMF